jgi:hypothetical protein
VRKMKRTVGSGAQDRLTPFEVAVLSRVVRANIIPEADPRIRFGDGAMGRACPCRLA